MAPVMINKKVYVYYSDNRKAAVGICKRIDTTTAVYASDKENSPAVYCANVMTLELSDGSEETVHLDDKTFIKIFGI